MDWKSFVHSGDLRVDAEVATLAAPLMRRAWSEIVDSHTALAMRDYTRSHECLGRALERAAEAYAAANGYDRGPEWGRDSVWTICSGAGGELAATVFERIAALSEGMRSWHGVGPGADGAAHGSVEAASALVALIESQMLT